MSKLDLYKLVINMRIDGLKKGSLENILKEERNSRLAKLEELTQILDILNQDKFNDNIKKYEFNASKNKFVKEFIKKVFIEFGIEKTPLKTTNSRQEKFVQVKELIVVYLLLHGFYHGEITLYTPYRRDNSYHYVKSFSQRYFTNKTYRDKYHKICEMMNEKLHNF